MGHERTPRVYGPVDLDKGLSWDLLDVVQPALAEVEASLDDFAGARVFLRCEMATLWVIAPAEALRPEDPRRSAQQRLAHALSRALVSRGIPATLEDIP